MMLMWLADSWDSPDTVSTAITMLITVCHKMTTAIVALVVQTGDFQDLLCKLCDVVTKLVRVYHTGAMWWYEIGDKFLVIYQLHNKTC